MAAERRRRRVGLRVRVSAVAVATVGVALAAGAVLLVGLVRSRLDTAATTAATLRARDVAALAGAGTLPRTLALPGEETAFVQVVDESGAVIASTGNIEGEPAVTTAKPLGSTSLVLTIPIAPLDQADAMRVIVLNTMTNGGPVTVYAGESLENADDTTAAVITVLAIGLPLLVLLVATVTWWAVGRTLRPVRRITYAMREITASDLHRRVPTPTTGDEIGELADTVNETLGRLDTSVEQQRRFVADASHELRGPLAALRADLEISVTHPERTAWPDVARDTLSDVERLQHLTEDLLLLARLDARQQRPPQPVNFAELVTEAVGGNRRDNITVFVLGTELPMTIEGDPEQLHRMTRNLLHNAAEHAEHRVTLTLARTDTTIRLSIADDGPGIPAEFREAVFERFVRGDTARTRDTGGTGLGLAIVADVIAGHHGSITVTDTHPHGATFNVELPINQPS